MRDEHYDYFYVEATSLGAMVTPNDIILTDEQWIVEDYYKRFTSAAVFSPEDINDTRSEHTISKQSLAAKMDSSLTKGGAFIVAIQNPKLPLTDSAYYRYFNFFSAHTITTPLTLNRRKIGTLEIGEISQHLR